MNYKEFNKLLKIREFSSVYLFTGPEYYIGHIIEKTLVTTVVSKGLEALNLTVFSDKNPDLKEVVTTCETLPLMSEKRVVIIRESAQIGNDWDKKAMDHFSAYLERPSHTTLLIIYWGQPDKRKKLYKTIQKSGEIINFEKLDARDLENWIRRRLELAKKNLSRSVLELFIQRSLYLINENKNMEMVDHDLNKLIDYVGNRVDITREDILLIMPQSIEDGVFKMIDYAMAGKKGQALNMLAQFYQEGESPFGVFSLLLRQIRMLLMVKIYSQRGIQAKEMASQMKLAPFIVNKILKNGRNYPIDNLWKLMLIGAELDAQMKKGEIDQNFGLELFLMKIS